MEHIKDGNQERLEVMLNCFLKKRNWKIFKLCGHSSVGRALPWRGRGHRFEPCCPHMKIRNDIKDYQVAQEMFGTNTKEQCKLVKKLRVKGIIIPLTEDFSVISEKGKDDCGWMISNTLLQAG